MEKEELLEQVGNEQVIFAAVVNVICCYFLPWDVRDISVEHHLSRQGGLVLGADGTS